MRPRFALHLAAIALLAVGVCWGTLAQSGLDRLSWLKGMSGADVKRMAAAGGVCNIERDPADAVVVPAAGLFDALPDGAAFRPTDERHVAPEPGTVAAIFWGPDRRVYAGPRWAWCYDGRRWFYADLDPADADRLRADLLVAHAAAQPPPTAIPPGR